VPQQVLINTSSAAPVTFNVATTTNNQGSWLNVTPASGSASGQTPGSVSVSVNPTGLAAGIYTGNLNVSIGGWLQSVNVTLVIQSTGPAASISHLRPEAATCTAS
jgi:hypothetical protein